VVVDSLQPGSYVWQVGKGQGPANLGVQDEASKPTLRVWAVGEWSKLR
jgi:hypothetical protein